MSYLTFEEISKIQPALEKGLIVSAYHWWSQDNDKTPSPVTIKELKEEPFFFSDNPFDWASPHLYDATRLFKIDIILRKPFICFEQFYQFEEVFVNPSPEYSLVVEGGFDSILYTPHRYGRGVRQGMVLNAKKNIVDIEEIDKPDLNLVNREQQKMAQLWTEILFESRKKS